MTTTPRLLTHRDGFVFVDKPPGWTVHRSAEGGPDLISWIDRSKLMRGARPVHRLDRDTSGVVLCAQPQVRARASAWFAERLVQKDYIAVVYGWMQPQGHIDSPIEDQEAVTEVTLQAMCAVEGVRLSVVALRPLTGRKHQLRRHLHSIRHPVVGDRRYSSNRNPPVPGAPERLWLHAASLTVPRRAPVESPLPADLAAHLALLQANRS